MTRVTTQDRVPTSLAAEIVTDPGARPIPCTITDLSATGAKIETGVALDLPPDFDLTILAGGETVHAEVRWRYESKIGVRFARPHDPASDRPTREKLVTENLKLWSVLETLAKRLTQLGEHVVLPADLIRPAALGKDAGALGREAAAPASSSHQLGLTRCEDRGKTVDGGLQRRPRFADAHE